MAGITYEMLQGQTGFSLCEDEVLNTFISDGSVYHDGFAYFCIFIFTNKRFLLFTREKVIPPMEKRCPFVQCFLREQFRFVEKVSFSLSNISKISRQQIGLNNQVALFQLKSEISLSLWSRTTTFQELTAILTRNNPGIIVEDQLF